MKLKKKLTAAQIEKYNVNQKIIQELANLESRVILFSIRKKPKLVEEISHETRFPLSTIYKKIHLLEDLALVFVEKVDFSSSGRRMKFYRSRIKEAQVTFKETNPRLILISNEKS